jgi:two-component system nitrate/nitrite response regulator NarL
MRFLMYLDEPLVADAIRHILGHAPDLEIDGIFDRIETVFTALKKKKSDLLLLTLTPEVHLGVLNRLRRQAPDCHIVLWTRVVSQELAHQAMELGIRGILTRTCSTEMLLKCLRKVHQGELWFDRRLTSSYVNCQRIELSPRQGDLAKMVAERFRNREIAESLRISEGAVKVYLSHLFEKLGVTDRSKLAQLVIRNLQPAENGQLFTGLHGTTLRALYIEEPSGIVEPGVPDSALGV